MYRVLRDYLRWEEVYPMNVLDVGKEKLLLIEPQGDIITFINEDIVLDDKSLAFDDTIVFAKQRWLVDVLPDFWGTTYTTSRYIIFVHSEFKKLKREISEGKEKNFRLTGSYKIKDTDDDSYTFIDKFIYNSF